ncbi:Salt-sensitive 3'-phosphoadenosine-5'-phosphatase HAL2/SAL1 [Phaffia rhodozyma]|uniref:3'(2'),5'-bisphosphate nucleotidase n=1 Tax=Phaffia rhodozyma TaxID=264483 RepID=A0A0F7SYF3_PHARH|nr:Salt-sensitive 3'-phosphoadenosine-5'-phosphatase HAL2/SAL1 [Phaffia rhodozyma]
MASLARSLHSDFLDQPLHLEFHFFLSPAFPLSLFFTVSISSNPSISSQMSVIVPTSNDLQKEAQLAVQAVLRACHITHKVQSAIKKDDTETKVDKSPVTVADYASQALLAHLLSIHFPSDPLIGEEDTTSLRSDSAQSASMRESITNLVNEALALESDQVGQKLDALSEDKVLEAIDRGNSEGGKQGRWWTCDPIDGTLGFLRGEQYAVCLTLVSESKPILGLIGCPNLPYPSIASPTSKGSLFLATASHGSFQRSLTLPLAPSPSAAEQAFQPISLSAPIPGASEESKPKILESVEAGHSSHSINESIADLVGLGEHVRMDSQAKYGALARGDGQVYLRVPTAYSGGKKYVEKVWDHASGWLLVKEAGGWVGDIWGRDLDFGVGRTLKENDGVIATASSLKELVLSSVRKAVTQANPDVEPPKEAQQAAIIEDAVADEIKEAEQAGEGIEKGEDGVVIGEEVARPTS